MLMYVCSFWYYIIFLAEFAIFNFRRRIGDTASIIILIIFYKSWMYVLSSMYLISASGIVFIQGGGCSIVVGTGMIRHITVFESCVVSDVDVDVVMFESVVSFIVQYCIVFIFEFLFVSYYQIWNFWNRNRNQNDYLFCFYYSYLFWY